MNGVIRASQAVRQGRFAGADNIPSQGCGDLGYQVLERSAKLVFGLADDKLRHLSEDAGGETFESAVD